jgi:hypothetical protein
MPLSPQSPDGGSENSAENPPEAEAHHCANKGNNQPDKRKGRSDEKPDKRQWKQQRFFQHITAPLF